MVFALPSTVYSNTDKKQAEKKQKKRGKMLIEQPPMSFPLS